MTVVVARTNSGRASGIYNASPGHLSNPVCMGMAQWIWTVRQTAPIPLALKYKQYPSGVSNCKQQQETATPGSSR
jgi:hypothetical protein